MGRRLEVDAPSQIDRIEFAHSDCASCLLLVVVRMRDCNEIEDGRYEATFSVKSEMLDVEGNANESVDGRDSPGKDVSRTLTLDEAILSEF
jgi:hypothetical protein